MLVPLYRLQGHGDHFYTTSETERDNAVLSYGYTIEGIAGYVNDGPTPAAVSPAEIVMVPSALELRDRFAMSAMQSIIRGRYHAGHYVGDFGTQCPEDAARAYAMADAMFDAKYSGK